MSSDFENNPLHAIYENIEELSMAKNYSTATRSSTMSLKERQQVYFVHFVVEHYDNLIPTRPCNEDGIFPLWNAESTSTVWSSDLIISFCVHNLYKVPDH